jgi:hypothetical protein
VKLPLRLMLPILERAYYFLPDAGLRLVQTYIQRCQEAGSEPDEECMLRMHAVLVAAGVVANAARPAIREGQHPTWTSR